MTHAANDDSLSPSGSVRATRIGKPAYEAAPPRVRQSDFARPEPETDAPAWLPSLFWIALAFATGCGVFALFGGFGLHL